MTSLSQTLPSGQHPPQLRYVWLPFSKGSRSLLRSSCASRSGVNVSVEPLSCSFFLMLLSCPKHLFYYAFKYASITYLRCPEFLWSRTLLTTVEIKIIKIKILYSSLQLIFWISYNKVMWTAPREAKLKDVMEKTPSSNLQVKGVDYVYSKN